MRISRLTAIRTLSEEPHSSLRFLAMSAIILMRRLRVFGIVRYRLWNFSKVMPNNIWEMTGRLSTDPVGSTVGLDVPPSGAGASGDSALATSPSTSGFASDSFSSASSGDFASTSVSGGFASASGGSFGDLGGASGSSASASGSVGECVSDSSSSVSSSCSPVVFGELQSES
jgi:hypothetical protein